MKKSEIFIFGNDKIPQVYSTKFVLFLNRIVDKNDHNGPTNYPTKKNDNENRSNSRRYILSIFTLKEKQKINI